MGTDNLTPMQEYILGIVKRHYALRKGAGIVPEVVPESTVNATVQHDVSAELGLLVEAGYLNCYENVNKIRMFYPDGAVIKRPSADTEKGDEQ